MKNIINKLKTKKMDITGKLKVKGESQQISDKFRKREFVITDDSTQYPQHISFQLTQDKCGILDDYRVGTEIKVHFNLRGREWKNPQGEVKYFNSLEAWRIEGEKNGETSAKIVEEKTPETFTAATDVDDLPF